MPEPLCKSMGGKTMSGMWRSTQELHLQWRVLCHGLPAASSPMLHIPAIFLDSERSGSPNVRSKETERQLRTEKPGCSSVAFL